MNVTSIIDLLPTELLNELAIETKVNRYSKKLQGQVLFKLLLHCILSHKDNSLRVMESAYESIAFGILNSGSDSAKVRYSSISERLSTISVVYFEKLYQACISIYGETLGEKTPSYVLFDSTIVALSSKLLKVGYRLRGSAENTSQIKFTIGLSKLPVCVNFYYDQQYTSENVALKETIFSYTHADISPVRIFDRGITSRKTHDKFTENNIPFISRINVNSRFEEHTPNSIKNPVLTNTLIITSDNWRYFFTEKEGRAKYPVRCIVASNKLTGEAIVFITNLHDLSATEITELYRRRWDIEVFFKFLKQELNFSHLINRSENGIKVMLYMTMIASILLLVYKKTNNLTGFKIMKLKFVHELEKELVKHFVRLCGGNPNMVNELFKKHPS